MPTCRKACADRIKGRIGKQPVWSDEGFTILEVLVTLALAATVTTGLGIALQAASRRAALDQGLSILRHMTALARAQALSSGDTATLTIDPFRGALQIRALSRHAVLPASISLRVTTAKEAAIDGEAIIAFFPDGSSSGAEFRLTTGNASTKASVAWYNGRFQNAQ